MGSLADTLVVRVDELLEARKQPLLATTPSTLAIQELATRIDALENAVREIAAELNARLDT